MLLCTLATIHVNDVRIYHIAELGNTACVTLILVVMLQTIKKKNNYNNIINATKIAFPPSQPMHFSEIPLNHCSSKTLQQTLYMYEKDFFFVTHARLHPPRKKQSLSLTICSY